MDETQGPGKAQPKKPRGFAAMPEAQRKILAAKGGRMVHAMCRGRKFTREEAAAQGRKGGLAAQAGGSVRTRFTSETARAAQARSTESRKKAT